MGFAEAMRRIVLDSQTDWEGWRTAARALVLAGVAPDDVRWSVGGRGGDALPEGSGSFGVSRALVSLASLAIQARDPERFDLLYRLVWRANAGEHVMQKTTDPELRRAQGLALAVRAEAHRMRTLVRFMPVSEPTEPYYLGWYEPAHHVLEADAQLIVRRFPDLAFSILTPDAAAHWDGAELRFSAGVDRGAVPDDARLLRWWHAHHAGLLRDARVGTAIPEAEELDEAPRPPDRAPLGPVVLPLYPDPALQEALPEAAECRRCHLHEAATQTVFGEGPARARVLFVGEQPGDQEDVIGRPFVGPAGQIMDRAMEEAGIDRRTIYITNAVKHFKFTPRGKRRIHQTPEAPEIQACRFWLDVELVRLRPKLVVAMGGTAARALLGRAVTITHERGRPLELPDGQTGFVTVHPSFLLRVPDEDAKAREYRAFVADLRKIAELVSDG
jgi:DNA polymerase